MKAQENQTNTTWIQIGKHFDRTTAIVQIFANFIGALSVTFYFAFLDNVPKVKGNILEEFTVYITMFILLVPVGIFLYRSGRNSRHG